MKKWKLLVMAVTALLFIIPAALAAAPAEGTDAASDSYARVQNIFYGTSSNRVDEETMALDRTATRSEGITVLVRLLGQEETAMTGSFTHPFSDVSPWAEPYVGYAYTSGLTLGKGDGDFGTADPLTMDVYATFLLRALGYSEAEGDFTWNTAAENILELGVYDRAFLDANRAVMTRGALLDLAIATRTYLVETGRTPVPEEPAPDEDGGEDPAEGQEPVQGQPPAPPAEGEDPGQSAPGVSAETPPVASPQPGYVPGDETAAAYIQRVFELVNDLRAQAGLEPLILDQALCECAGVRTEEIETLFDHTRPDGRRWFTVLDDRGIEYARAGENLARRQATPEEVVADWMASETHRDNILKPTYTRIGISCQDRRWVQLFATYYND